jgi:hypothetical protein
MHIHAKFRVRYGQGVHCRLVAYFYYDDASDTKLKAADAKYSDDSGYVSAWTDFTPAYDPADYDDLQIFLPHRALNMADGSWNLKFRLRLYDRDGRRFFGTSPWHKFHLTKGSPAAAPAERASERGANPEATYESARIVHNVYVNGRKGMRIHANFSVRNGQGVSCRLIAYFFYDNANSTPVRSGDPNYRTDTGNLSVGQNFKPAYDPAYYKDYSLFVPYDALDASLSTGEWDLKFQLELYDNEGGRFFGRSPWYKFHFSRAATEGESQDFTLYNRTGLTIKSLYIRPHNTSDWQEDVLGRDTLSDGENTKITFDRRDRNPVWDIKIVDEDGREHTQFNLNLYRINQITVTGKPDGSWNWTWR